MSKLGPYELNQIYCGECSALMADLPADSIPFWLTSPPYDGLRTYKGYTFDFEAIARQLWHITQPGGVGVWVVADETKDGSESGTSFRQALYFMGLGFNLHDTMIYQRKTKPLTHNRYEQEFEYMFIFAKPGGNVTCNHIKTPSLTAGVSHDRTTQRHRESNGQPTALNGEWVVGDEKIIGNVWEYKVGQSQSTKDKIAHDHPAIFPEALARDHILSWSNPGDLVFDPMAGSGTVWKMAHLTGRKSLNFEISEEYCQIARRRVEAVMSQPFIPGLVEVAPQPVQLGLE